MLAGESGVGDLAARAVAQHDRGAFGACEVLVAPVRSPVAIAIGSAVDIAARIAAYRRAGADQVAVAPSTAEDPAGRRTVEALTRPPSGRVAPGLS